MAPQSAAPADGRADPESLSLEYADARRTQRSMMPALAVVLGLAVVAGVMVYLGRPPPGGDVKVVLLHINDHHGHLPAESLAINRSLAHIGHLTSVPDAAELHVSYGGFPMVAAVLRQLEDAAAAKNEPVFKFHNGDALTGTAFYSLFEHGEVDALMMSELCFDAFVLGNHEFDHGDQNLAYFLDSLLANSTSKCGRAPAVLASNVRPGETSPLQGKVHDYEVVDRGGVRLGVVGINTKVATMESSSPSHGTVLTDEIPAAQAAIDELKGMGIHHIVVISHTGYLFDVQQAALQLRGAGVILGGHSHTLLASDLTGKLLKGWDIGAEESYPTIVHNADGSKVCVVQAWDYAHVVGRLEVEFNEHGDVLSCTGTPHVPYDEDSFQAEWDSNSEPLSGGDLQVVKAAFQALPGFESAAGGARWAAVTEVLAVYAAEVEDRTSEKVGVAAETLYSGSTPGQNNAATWEHGNDLAPLIGRAFVGTLAHGCLAMLNGGGIRQDIRAGAVSYNDLQVVMPFSNTLVEMNVTGQQIKDVLEHLMALIKESPDRGGGFPYGWGLRYEIDLSQPVGSLVSSLETNCKVAEGGWAPLDMARSYLVATTNYLAAGKDGWALFGDREAIPDRVETGSMDLEVMLTFVRALDAQGGQLAKAPIAEYALQRYVDENGCDHSEVAFGNCPATPGGKAAHIAV